ncbi:hypothetical protein SBOR_4086 [Sclerotinia borealis F-4128]|uniref:Aminotransferase class I/classII large domain-containing protein n=1 Tax=Sclerotinia borealis (strain F-4128) TaxID=1432307 RepID=W9CHT4_SCLBF|nr:hypothetical protein SBOR_4086 [Sclerotinia borealis F-4128]
MPTLEESMTSALKRRAQNSSLRNLSLPSTTPTTTGVTPIDFSSNDFLSLSTSPVLHNAYLALLRTHFSPPPFHNSSPSTTLAPPTLGSTGSRLLSGNSPLALHLEAQISTFHRSPHLDSGALLFNSGFDANSAFFACIPQKEDVVVYDEQIHASVHEGMRGSRAKRFIAFRHNDVGDLRRVLDSVRREGIERNVIVAVESLYSMDGDICPLRAVVKVVEEIFGLGGMTEEGRGYIVVDEAHSTGVYGPEGRGLVCELGLEGKIFARLHTFGKALAGNGAIILTTSLTRHYLLNYARPLIYSTSLSTPSLLLIAASYSLFLSSSTNPLQSHLRCLSHHFTSLLSHLPLSSHLKPQPQNLSPETENLNWTPIFSLQTPEPKKLATYCQKMGYNVRAIMSPTVKKGRERVRVCLHAGNTFEEIEGLVRCVREWIGVMDKRGEAQIGDVVDRNGRGESDVGVGVEEEHIAGVGMSFKGKGRTERAKL